MRGTRVKDLKKSNWNEKPTRTQKRAWVRGGRLAHVLAIKAERARPPCGHPECLARWRATPLKHRSSACVAQSRN